MFKYLILIVMGSALIFSCNATRGLYTKFDCSTFVAILEHPEIRKTLALNQIPRLYSRIRIFFLDSNTPNCEGQIGDWTYKIYNDGIRPSMNTGYHRDIFFRENQKGGKAIYEVFLASYENDNNRQSTYLFEFEKILSDGYFKIDLIGFSEYTDN